MASFKILDSRKIPARDLKRAGQNDLLIIYQQTDGPGIFTTVIPAEHPTDDQIKKAIADDQSHRNKLQGKTFSV